MSPEDQSLWERAHLRPEMLGPRRRRELLEAASARSRRSTTGAFARLRGALWPIAQTAIAAALAWLVANRLLGHTQPLFAPVAAIMSLGATRGQRARQATQMMVGVAIGVGLGGLLVHAIGAGVLQLALVIALAMSAAVLFDGGHVLLTEAAVSAALVVTLGSPTGSLASSRLGDALTGGVIALLFSQLLFPVHPVRVVREAAESVLDETGRTLFDVAAALEARDLEAAEHALVRARRVSDDWSRFEQALDAGHEAARFAPLRRRLKERVSAYRDIGLPLDLMVRDIHVLARGATRALMIGDPVPRPLIGALRDLARATHQVAGQLAQPQTSQDIRDAALDAVRAATAVVPADENLSVSVLVGYTQAAAADMLRTLGIDRQPAHEAVGRAVMDTPRS